MKLPDPQKWVLTGFAAILAPWQEELSRVELISPYYQPQTQVAASIAGVFVGTAVLAVAQDDPEGKNRRRFGTATATFVLLLLICLSLKYTVDTVWQPGELGVIALRLLWPAVYICVNMALSAAVAFAILSFSERTEEK